MTVGELIFDISFKADTVKINDVIGMIGRLNFNSVLASFGVKELYDGLRHIMGIADETAVGMNLFGAETGLSSQKMTQWSKYAEQMGVSGDTVTDALTGLQKKMAGFKLGTDSSLLTPLYLLNQAGAGITDKDLSDPFSFLEKTVKTLPKVNSELKTTILGMLSVRSELAGIHSFSEANLIATVSPDQVSTLLQYHKIWTNLSQTMNMLFINLASQYAPELISLGEALSGTARYVSENIIEFKAWAEVLVGIAALFIPFLRIPYVLAMIVSHFKEISETAKNAWEWMNKVANAVSPKAVADAGNSMREYLKGQLSQVGIIQHGASASYGTPEPSATSITQSNVFHISGIDAKDIGQHVSKHLNDKISDAVYQNSRNL